MTTEDKAMALVNEVCAEWEVNPATEDDMGGSACFSALTRAIEQHESFRQEVSDAVEEVLTIVQHHNVDELLSRFIIAKPDPLVEALNDMKARRAGSTMESYAACLRAALAKHNGRIVFDD